MKVIEWLKGFDGFLLSLAGGITVLVLLIILAAVLESNERAEFMRECEQDRPKYECTAMWRSGDKPAPVVIVR